MQACILDGPGFGGGSNSGKSGAMTGKMTNKFSPRDAQARGATGAGSRATASVPLAGDDVAPKFYPAVSSSRRLDLALSAG